MSKNDEFVIDGKILLEYRGDAENVIVPEGVEYISAAAFMGSDFKSVVLPQALKCISEAAFKDCKNLRQIAIPERTERISLWAFDGCSSLESVNFININKILIEQGAFRNTLWTTSNAAKNIQYQIPLTYKLANFDPIS